MEKLTVSNFLNLKHIELDLAKITLIIGSQAQGKSILAKLVFFFKDLIVKYNKKSKSIDEKITQDALKDFLEIFPYYSWENQKFKIIYQLEDLKIYLINKNRDKPELHFSDTFQTEQNFKSIKPPVFIPSNRSFFATLQENLFLFLEEDLPIDYFLKRFGFFYERVKSIFKNQPPWLEESLSKNAIEDLFDKVLIGQYRYEKGQDWIYSQNGKKINLMNASSGQQEVLPIILILGCLGSSVVSSRLFFIEEPEAHLFPSSQKSIVELISLAFNFSEKNNHFFITTHSPYILTAFNNLIQAGNTLKAIDQKTEQEVKREKLFKIIPKNQILDTKDFGVYTLENGEIKSIINEKNQLIDTNVIDEVSNQISEEFEKLLDLEFEGA